MTPLLNVYQLTNKQLIQLSYILDNFEEEYYADDSNNISGITKDDLDSLSKVFFDA